MVADLFLEPHQVDELGTHWHNLAGIVPQLDDMIAGSVMGVASSLGIRLANAPRSRPPINVAAYDHIDLIHTSALGWVTNLTDDTTTSWPDGTGPAALCRHLHIHADRIATRPWAKDCLDEAKDLDTTAQHITNPGHGESITDRHDPTDTNLHHQAHHAQGDAADMIVVHHKVTGHTLTEHQIRQWQRDGKLTRHTGPGGEAQYRYHEVAAAARAIRIRRLPIRHDRINLL